MKQFCIEAESENRSGESIIYTLTTTRKLIEGCGLARVYGVNCRCVARPESAAELDDIAANPDEAVRIICSLASKRVSPDELNASVSALLG